MDMLANKSVFNQLEMSVGDPMIEMRGFPRDKHHEGTLGYKDDIFVIVLYTKLSSLVLKSEQTLKKCHQSQTSL
jgi:hypothetical protein